MAEAGEVAMEQETASAIPALVTSSLLCIIRNLPPANGRATRIDQPRVTTTEQSHELRGLGNCRDEGTHR